MFPLFIQYLIPAKVIDGRSIQYAQVCMEELYMIAAEYATKSVVCVVAICNIFCRIVNLIFRIIIIIENIQGFSRLACFLQLLRDDWLSEDITKANAEDQVLGNKIRGGIIYESLSLLVGFSVIFRCFY